MCGQMVQYEAGNVQNSDFSSDFLTDCRLEKRQTVSHKLCFFSEEPSLKERNAFMHSYPWRGRGRGGEGWIPPPSTHFFLSNVRTSRNPMEKYAFMK